MDTIKITSETVDAAETDYYNIQYVCSEAGEAFLDLEVFEPENDKAIGKHLRDLIETIFPNIWEEVKEQEYDDFYDCETGDVHATSLLGILQVYTTSYEHHAADILANAHLDIFEEPEKIEEMFRELDHEEDIAELLFCIAAEHNGLADLLVDGFPALADEE